MIKEVTRAVIEILAKLTIIKKERLKIKIEKFYLDHIASLRLKGLLEGEILKFKKVIKK